MSSPLLIAGPAGYDPVLGEMRTNNCSGGGSAAVVPGYRMNDSGGTLNQDRYFAVETVTGSTVTLMAGHAYKAYATTSALTLTTETVPANSFGLEGHIELFVGNTGYVVAGANVVLTTPLEPDAVNNCTVRFHDGYAIVSVEDHVAGYIVTAATGTTAGTIPYALSSASQEYVSFDASLDGLALYLADCTTNGEKHVVGNGYAQTVLTGGVSCTSKTTFANLAMSGVANSGGTMTLGDVNIPAGATVSVSGGGLAVERVTGAGVIDLGGTGIPVVNQAEAHLSGVTITNGFNHAFVASSGGHVYLSNCMLTGNGNAGAGVYGAAVYLTKGGFATISGGTVAGNTADQGDIYAQAAPATSSVISARDCTLGTVVVGANGDLILGGTVSAVRIRYLNTAGQGTVHISSGTVLSMTSSIDTGNGIFVDSFCLVNGATVTGGTYTSIQSNGTTTPPQPEPAEE